MVSMSQSTEGDRVWSTGFSSFKSSVNRHQSSASVIETRVL